MKCLVCNNNDAGHLYECAPCQVAMVRWLQEIEDYAVIISVTTTPTRGAGGRGSPGYRSTPPLNLDKVVALDPRSQPGHVNEDGEACTSRPDDTGTWTRSLAGGLQAIGAWLREERDEPIRYATTAVEEARYLRGITGWLRAQQFVDDVASDLKELHRQARGLANDRPPGPMGRCLGITCDGVVFQVTLPGVQRETAGRCNGCHRVYSGLDLVRLGAAQEVAG